jgi:hypothetical protein
MTTVSDIAYRLAPIIIRFSGIILTGGIVAYLAAYRLGGNTRRSRRATFALVGVLGAVIALAVTLVRLRGFS